MFIGRRQYFLDQVDSTNSYAAKLIAKSEPSEGTAVLSYNQISGRGQPVSKNGILVRNVWHMAAGLNIASSIILRPHFLKVSKQFLLSMAVSNAIQKLLTTINLKEVSIKWPNDIYVGDRKIAGILIENSIQSDRINTAIVGIGINVNEVDFPEQLPNPTSVKIELERDWSLEDFVKEIYSYLEVEYLKLKQGKDAEIKHYYQQHMYRYQEEHFFIIEGEKRLATIMGVNEIGSIVLKTGDRLKEFHMKEMAFLI